MIDITMIIYELWMAGTYGTTCTYKVIQCLTMSYEVILMHTGVSSTVLYDSNGFHYSHTIMAEKPTANRIAEMAEKPALMENYYKMASGSEIMGGTHEAQVVRTRFSDLERMSIIFI